MNWNGVMWRGAKLPLACLTLGMIAYLLTSRIAQLSTGLERIPDLAVGVGLMAAVVTWIIFCARLLLWERGRWRECRFCSGPLGWQQDGRVYFGQQLSDFRRCYNCGRPTPDHE